MRILLVFFCDQAALVLLDWVNFPPAWFYLRSSRHKSWCNNTESHGISSKAPGLLCSVCCSQIPNGNFPECLNYLWIPKAGYGSNSSQGNVGVVAPLVLVDLFICLKWTLKVRLWLLCAFGFKWTNSISQSGEIDKSGCCDGLVLVNSSLGLSIKPVTRLFSYCPNLSADSQYYSKPLLMFRTKFQKCSAVSLFSVPTKNFRFQVAHHRGFVCAVEKADIPLGIPCAEYLLLKTKTLQLLL